MEDIEEGGEFERPQLKRCCAIIKQGPREGEECGKLQTSKYCSRHRKEIASKNVVETKMMPTFSLFKNRVEIVLALANGFEIKAGKGRQNKEVKMIGEMEEKLDELQIEVDKLYARFCGVMREFNSIRRQVL